MTLIAQDASVAPVLFFLAVLVLAFVAIGIGMLAARKRDADLADLAQKLGGRVRASGILSFPELHFPHADRTVALKYIGGGEDESPRTYLSIPWPNFRLRSEIFPEGPMSPLRKLIGMQDIEIGSESFDRQFVITGNDEAAIKAFLTPEAQARLMDLYRLTAGTLSLPGLYLQIAGGVLTITKTSYLNNRATLERFIDLFLRFYDAATESPPAVSSAGIEFLDSPKTESDTAPHCIVCGEALTRDLVSCRSCKTPHHRDCWQYFGGCATYACGGKQQVPAK